MSLGVSLDYSKTYPGRLQDLLNEQNGPWQVVNLSVSDWGSVQQLTAPGDSWPRLRS